jgi:hypothetical protein
MIIFVLSECIKNIIALSSEKSESRLSARLGHFENSNYRLAGAVKLAKPNTFRGVP